MKETGQEIVVTIETGSVVEMTAIDGTETESLMTESPSQLKEEERGQGHLKDQCHQHLLRDLTVRLGVDLVLYLVMWFRCLKSC